MVLNINTSYSSRFASYVCDALTINDMIVILKQKKQLHSYYYKHIHIYVPMCHKEFGLGTEYGL